MHLYFEMNEQTTVQVQGADRTKLLNNMCTQDLKNLIPGRGTETFLTDVKGRILAHVLVVASEHEMDLVTVAGQAERIIHHLDRYTIREDVIAIDLSSQSTWLAFPSATQVASALALDLGALPVEPYAHREIPAHLDDGTTLALQLYKWPSIGSEGIVARFTEQETLGLLNQLHLRNFRCASKSEFHAMRIANAWPLFGIDFDEKNLPQEIGRDAQAISFTKGCYLGQETVARLDALGQVQKKLVRLRIEGHSAPAAGARLTSHEVDAGWITSAAAVDGHCLAFGFVKRAFLNAGTSLSVGDANATVESTE